MGFNLCFPDNHDIGHIFVCLFTIHIFSLVNHVNFFYQLVCHLIIELEEFFIYSGYKYVLEIFSSTL